MKRLYLSTFLISLATSASALTTPGASIFEFNNIDWSDGGTLTGFFEAEDVNGDGQISQFAGEVYDFSATYQSANFGTVTFGSDAFGEGGLTGLVYNLDGLGTIGDSSFGDIEGLGVVDETGEFYLGLGPGPVDICDGTATCGFISNDPFGEESDGGFGSSFAETSSVINVTSGPLGENDGRFEENPLLPDGTTENGGFIFNVDGSVVGGEIFFIDPEIAVGYTYEVTGTTFAAVQAPTLAAVPDGDGLYTLAIGAFETTLAAGQVYNFAADDVTSFTITGIDTGLMLDPTDDMAFVTGIAVDDVTSTFTVTQTPITQDVGTGTGVVPLPASGLLLLSGLLGISGLRRMRKG